MPTTGSTNLRNPVRFSAGGGRRRRENHATFVEVSPHPLLTHAISGSLESARPRGDVQVAATLNRDNPETLAFHTQLATVRPPSAANSANCRRWQKDSRTSHRRHGCMPVLGRDLRPLTGSRPMLIRCWGRTLKCRPAAIMCGRRDVGTEAHPVAGRSQGARPTGHARDRFRRDGAGRRQRSLGLPAEAVAVEPGRGRTDASAGRPDPGDDAADPQHRRWRPTWSCRDPLTLGRRQLASACGRPSRGDSAGNGARANHRRRRRRRHRGVAGRPLRRVASHRVCSTGSRLPR